MVFIGTGPFAPEHRFPLGQLIASLSGEDNHGVVIVGYRRAKGDGGRVHRYKT